MQSNNERPQEGNAETFRVFWRDKHHSKPVMVRLRFYSKSRADLCAEHIAFAAPGVKVWVEKETTPAAQPEGAKE